MGNLIVLGDSATHDILINLTKEEILTFKDIIQKCLSDYSAKGERKHQPSPGIINRPEGQKCLFRPFTSSEAVGAKIIVQPAPASAAAASGLHGMIAVCDSDGMPKGILNAEEITGYRTSMCAMIPFLWRRRTDNVVVFGAGKQALWHLRLMLALRGDEISHIIIVNRTASRAEQLIATVEEENDTRWKSKASMRHIDPSRSDYPDELKECLAAADAIFCTTGAKEPLFPMSHLDLTGRERQPYISAVGSWQPDMIELDPQLVDYAALNSRSDLPESSGISKSSILVDDKEGVGHHSGEAAQSKMLSKHMVEVGDVIHSLQADAGEDETYGTWLRDGLVVYKSVGVGLVDLAASNAILGFARERNLGTAVSGF
ncbi:NAD(P)-binding protein [Astrocystis sublimbata]|nr:NAD(P)-binding protein [Astrocystis sublimbata]